jgi:hypothetical protein
MDKNQSRLASMRAYFESVSDEELAQQYVDVEDKTGNELLISDYLKLNDNMSYQPVISLDLVAIKKERVIITQSSRIFLPVNDEQIHYFEECGAIAA